MSEIRLILPFIATSIFVLYHNIPLWCFRSEEGWWLTLKVGIINEWFLNFWYQVGVLPQITLCLNKQVCLEKIVSEVTSWIRFIKDWLLVAWRVPKWTHWRLSCLPNVFLSFHRFNEPRHLRVYLLLISSSKFLIKPVVLNLKIKREQFSLSNLLCIIILKLSTFFLILKVFNLCP